MSEVPNSDVIIIKDYPPNIEDIRKALGEPPKNAIFAFGDAIFNPSGMEISEPTRIHELTHMSYQFKDLKGWWDQYLNDPEFRLAQELEAFSNEYNCYRMIEADRNKRARFLHSCAERLSAGHYGHMVSFSEAFKLIKDHAAAGSN